MTTPLLLYSIEPTKTHVNNSCQHGLKMKSDNIAHSDSSFLAIISLENTRQSFKNTIRDKLNM